MKRREAIRNVILVSAGAAFLYSCKEKGVTDAALLDELTETILPKDDFIGAKDLKTGDFVLMMSDDCLSPEKHEVFSKGMKAFHESRFVEMPAGERKEYIMKLDGDAKEFFEMVKQGTIQNFMTSEKYLKEVRNITTLIPPKFQACATVTNV